MMKVRWGGVTGVAEPSLAHTLEIPRGPRVPRGSLGYRRVGPGMKRHQLRGTKAWDMSFLHCTQVFQNQ